LDLAAQVAATAHESPAAMQLMRDSENAVSESALLGLGYGEPLKPSPPPQVVDRWFRKDFLLPTCSRAKGPHDTCLQFGLGGYGSAQYTKVPTHPNPNPNPRPNPNPKS
jgi:hypothetical protein